MRKVLSVIVVILGGLMALGGLIIPGLLVVGAGVWIWPFRKKGAEKATSSPTADPLWMQAERESLYHDYEYEKSSGDNHGGDAGNASGNDDGGGIGDDDGGGDFGE